MNRFRRFVVFATLISGLIAFPVVAQESTEVPTEPAPTAEVTPEPTPAPEQPPPSLFSGLEFVELLLLMGLSAAAGGGILAIALRFLERKDVRDRVENARESWSDEQKQLLADFTGMFERTNAGILDFLKAVQDGKPNQ